GMRAAARAVGAAPPALLKSVAALANAGVVAQRAARRTDKRAGSHVTVDDLCNGRTGQRPAGRALRVGRKGCAAAIALFAGGKAGNQQDRAGKTENDGFLHSVLPVLWTRLRAVGGKGASNIARAVWGRN